MPLVRRQWEPNVPSSVGLMADVMTYSTTTLDAVKLCYACYHDADHPLRKIANSFAEIATKFSEKVQPPFLKRQRSLPNLDGQSSSVPETFVVPAEVEANAFELRQPLYQTVQSAPPPNNPSSSSSAGAVGANPAITAPGSHQSACVLCGVNYTAWAEGEKEKAEILKDRLMLQKTKEEYERKVREVETREAEFETEKTAWEKREGGMIKELTALREKEALRDGLLAGIQEERILQREVVSRLREDVMTLEGALAGVESFMS
ncbi:hypothetical protein BJ508DRAFT_312329 [Ascobolus immersus RN42]|uniref:Uncharacterized protein n=1 Tax=Ascobolus immersus RN42 TaxID=1160509 RepID=A0A3N4HP24_ASCIM|nr:hypothetical protein BJ508DRAFT_312329 [Ascobolus immersus RN42]